MFKKVSLALLAGASCVGAGLPQAAAVEAAPPSEPAGVYAAQSQQPPMVRTAYVQRSNMGGGFIEFLFGGGQDGGERYRQQPDYQQPQYDPRGPLLSPTEPQQLMRQQEDASEPARPAFDPKFEKQLVEYHGKESAGTIVIDTPNKFLFLVEGNGRALRYGIGVGRPGFTWSGRQADFREEGMAGMDAAAGNAGAAPRFTASHGGWAGQPAWRPRDVSGFVALSHPRLQ